MKLSTDKMIAKKEGGIGWMIFNNPERRNAISLAMREAMVEIFEDYQADDNVRVLVMRGAGDKAFVSGADISEFKEKRNSAESAAYYDSVSAKSREAMASFDKPIIAMIQGFCVGGGLATALNADLRIAAEGSQFGIPAAKLGLGYGFDQLGNLNDIVGPAFAKEIMFTGRRFDAEKALSIGLINVLVPASELEATVREYAEEIAGNAPLTVMTAKATIGELVKNPDDRDVGKIEGMVKDCFDSADFKEGREAFMEKRKPAFQGR